MKKKATKKSKYNAVFLNFGYAEGSYISPITFKCDYSYKSKEECVTSLAESLFCVWMDNLVETFEFNQRRGFKYDPRTGELLWPKLDILEFVDWLRDLPGKTCNDFGSDILEFGWSPYLNLKEMAKLYKTTVEIDDMSEVVIVSALTQEFLNKQICEQFPSMEGVLLPFIEDYGYHSLKNRLKYGWNGNVS